MTLQGTNCFVVVLVFRPDYRVPYCINPPLTRKRRRFKVLSSSVLTLRASSPGAALQAAVADKVASPTWNCLMVEYIVSTAELQEEDK